jgi:hypothetical protein
MSEEKQDQPAPGYTAREKVEGAARRSPEQIDTEEASAREENPPEGEVSTEEMVGGGEPALGAQKEDARKRIDEEEQGEESEEGREEASPDSPLAADEPAEADTGEQS